MLFSSPPHICAYRLTPHEIRIFRADLLHQHDQSPVCSEFLVCTKLHHLWYNLRHEKWVTFNILFGRDIN